MLYHMNGEDMIYPPLIKHAWNYHISFYKEYYSFCEVCFERLLYPFAFPSDNISLVKSKYLDTL